MVHMYPIVEVQELNNEVTKMVIRAPQISKKIKPGQFIMLRIDKAGERIPLTMNDADPQAGTVTIIFQAVGATTKQLKNMRAGEALLDFAGPFGNATEFNDAKRIAVIGGGLGTAIAYPQAKWLYEQGAEVDVITGFRTKDLILLEKEIDEHSTRHIIMTDDGSNGNKGLVTKALQQRINDGADYDLVLAVGPMIMMKLVAAMTKEHGIRTLVSMNPLMIDGTGMCGGCRVKVGNKYLHACVDGPDFDGHQIDFDEAMRRSSYYSDFEAQANALTLDNDLEYAQQDKEDDQAAQSKREVKGDEHEQTGETVEADQSFQSEEAGHQCLIGRG